MKISDELIVSARAAREKSYSPYSGFSVGAALLGESGKIYSAANVENASYGLSVCAERNAVFAAICAGERRIKAIALTPSVVPCGACLQVMSEFCTEDFRIFIEGDGREYSLSDFLPHSFKLE